MGWIEVLGGLQEQRVPAVLVTLVSTRGHTPRAGGAKLVVTADGQWGSVGGGNLEATAIQQARAMLAAGQGVAPSDGDGWALPRILDLELNEKAPADYGKQCCGGEVSLLLESIVPLPAVVVFGMGHVGQEIVRVLSRHELELHLVDSREEFATPAALPALADSLARVHWHHAPQPETIVPDLPRGSHVLVLTHDHAQDAAVCDAALWRDDIPFLGLIGSSSKWRRIEKRLRELGHSAADTDRVVTPIGDPSIVGKEPAVIALAVAVDMLARLAITHPQATPSAPQEAR